MLQPKVNSLLIGMLIGVIATGLVAIFALYGNNLRWQREAYEHYAGVYTFDAKKFGSVKWMWFDDYLKKEYLPKHESLHGKPSPVPGHEKMSL